MQIKVPKKLLPIFTSLKRFIVIYGGRDSSKSHSIARRLILLSMSESCLILCTRHIQLSIKTSSYALLVKIIKEYQFDSEFNIVDNEIRCLRTGSKFIFMGLWNNLDNITSLEGVKYVWVEEAKRVTYDAWKILIPTIRMEGSQFFISFNPDQLDDPVYDMFITHEHPEALVIKINYDENPFLSDTSRKEIEYMKVNKPDDFLWIYGGNCRATSEARILHNIVIHDFEIDKSRQPYFGMDHGYIDPTVVIHSYIYDNELYICNEFYKSGLNPEQLKREMFKIEWALNQHIIADSARPELNKMLSATGRFQISGARKSIGQPQKQGAFKYAMTMYLKQFNKIHIHATKCPNSARELTRWSFEVDKNDKILDIVADADDHCCDALIYSLERPAAQWYRSNFIRGESNSLQYSLC